LRAAASRNRDAGRAIFRKEITEFAARERFPAVYPFAEMAEAGGLMSYGTSRIDLFRRAASYVANILNGAKPSDMPIELPSKHTHTGSKRHEQTLI